MLFSIAGLIAIFHASRSGYFEREASQQRQNLPGGMRYGTTHRAPKTPPALSGDCAHQDKTRGNAPSSLDRERQLAAKRELSFEELHKALAGAKKQQEAEAERKAEEQKRQRAAVLSSEQCLNMTPSDLYDALVRRSREIAELLAWAKKHLGSVDDYMLRHMQRNTSGSIESVLNLRRLLDALTLRLSEVEDFLNHCQQSFDVKKAQHLLLAPLKITEDSLNALISADPLPPLRPSEWYPTVVSLLRRITRRRSIYKALKIELPPE
jgi:hypothetical protein